MLAPGAGERVDSMLDDPEIDQAVGRRLGARTGLFVPLVVRGRAIGVIVAHDKLGDDPRFTDDDLRLAEIFAARAAVAVDLSERVARDAAAPCRRRRRSSSADASRASSTTRPARRSRRSCSV